MTKSKDRTLTMGREPMMANHDITKLTGVGGSRDEVGISSFHEKLAPVV
jgi:hypothetical protein